MTIYVDIRAPREGNGRKESPFRHIDDAARIARPGDEVLVAPGVYREYVNPRNPGREDADLELSVSHAESDGRTQIRITCGGAAYNPFDQDDDVLGMTILKNMARQLDYSYTDNRNQINIIL